MANGQGGRSGGGFQPQGGVMGQAGFQPSPRPMGPPSGLPPQLQGTGGVRSPAGPYGPPGFIGGLPGSLPVGGAQPLNPGSGTTGGVGTTMQPNQSAGGPPPGYIGIPWGEYGPGDRVPQRTGGADPNPAGPPAPQQGMIYPPGSTANNGPRLPPIPPGTHPFIEQNWGFLNAQPGWAKAGTPEWFNSPQGMNAQAALAQRGTYGMGPGTLGTAGQHAGRPDPRTNSGEGYVSPMSGMTRQQAAAQSQSNWANPDWRMQQVMAGKIAPTSNAELQAMLANMAPADREAYIAKYKSIGLDPTYQGGGGTGPFGN